MRDRLGIQDQISFQVKKETKIVRDGLVGILYSDGLAGWYTWHHIEELIRDPEVVHLVECREKAPPEDRVYYNEKIHEYCRSHYGNEHTYEGINTLKIMWIPLGEKFMIKTMGRSEQIIFEDPRMEA